MYIGFFSKSRRHREDVLKNKFKGLTLVELLVTLIILAVLLATASPSYFDFLVKRKTTGAVENIASLIVNAKMESIKRNQPVTVSFLNNYDGDKWCFGYQLGTTTCDCGEDNSDATAYCDITESDAGVRNTRLYSGEFGDASVGNISTFSGATNFTFDPVLGLLLDSSDWGSLDVISENGKYQVTISINGAGRVSRCTNSTRKLVGYNTC